MTQSTMAAQVVVPLPSTFRPEMAFPFLSDDMLLRLASYGREVVCDAGTGLWTSGEREVDLFVVLEGAVEVSAQGEDGNFEPLTTLSAKAVFRRTRSAQLPKRRW